MSTNLDKIKEFLINENRGPRGNVKCKTVILLDETGSISHLIEKTKKNNR